MKQSNREPHLLELPDGRRLAYAEYGDPQGAPLFYCHGFPGSRLEAGLFVQSAGRHGFRVIAPDRNGLGASSALPGRRMLDWPADVAALADALGIDRFHLLGLSGGGPYALACALRLSQRLKGVALVCPLGPLDRPENLRAMRWPALLNFNSIRTLPLLTGMAYRHIIAPLVKRQPKLLYRMMLSMAPSADYRVLSRPQVQAVIIDSLVESIRQGAEGVLQEMALYTAPWGFTPEEIQQPVLLWHGTADDTVPPMHGRDIAQRLPNCTACYIEDEGHFSLPVNHMDRILQALARENG